MDKQKTLFLYQERSLAMRRIREDIRAIKQNDPAARTSLEVILTYPGIHALWFHRVSHFLFNHGFKLLARINSQISRFITGIEIHPGAQIGRRVFIDHGMGIVIGETAVIEDDVKLYHGVTLGGTGKECGKRHPTVRRGAMISAHVQILGPIEIGEFAKIGAAAVVLESIPAYATAVGLPAKVVRIDKEKQAIEEAKNDTTI
ncbi:serine O-acetyltransferase EpsC [Vagococcus lutrae]|nr:serine O-acetyltransferase EpsC [Vagococcus lutrae]MDO5741323.1 serine O-acetyltransferase EpsC [Vagococcus sp.]MDT2801892.1 serine O-acetyltransferase [Vagococcus lutrae]MDT2806831.1 serine O-acetyltransferase [Vagococcus lutrae]MDT2807245.1 serine O-acetyltransferase [Vagococcus lutrae]MDT2811841.1 serine O-acetyltransferase [Vagococcus lutrae]